jgi:two-component system, LytTR family, sensor kinase
MNLAFFTGRRLSVSLHVIAWIIIFAFPVYVFTFESHTNDQFFFRFFLHAIAYVAIFYLNYLWLVPSFFIKGKKRNYFIITILVIGCFYLAIEAGSNLYEHFNADGNQMELKFEEFWKMNNLPRPPQSWHWVSYFFTTILVSGFGLGLRLANQYVKDEKVRKELERERLNSELAFLKNQISPHFFFNTLNNIYSLVEINADDAQKSILRLSKLMRYLLYESEQGNTQLSHEIEFMQNYVDLMKLRLSDKVRLELSFPEPFTDISIPPLLFVPFIENAFKHGISYREASYIKMSLWVDSSHVRFTCSNSLGSKQTASPETHSGIGLENVKKRLALLFPQKHELSISKSDNSFDVSLSITVS